MADVVGETAERADIHRGRENLSVAARILGCMSTDALARARDGDTDAFDRLVAPLRRELHAHCYRMLGSAHDADDALQEALLRAWRGLHRFEERSSLRSWLYTVATRTCLDAIDSRGRRALPMDLGPASEHAVVADTPMHEVAWLEPYPDVQIERREAVELAFVAAVQHLPGNQRAALLLFEVLGFSADEIASMMATSRASVHSALQRARRIVAERVPPVSQTQTLRELGDERVRTIVIGYAEALARGDADGLVALLTEDVTWSMPPLPHWYSGRDAVVEFARAVPMTICGEWRRIPTVANGQPALASYLRNGDVFEAFAIDVLTLEGAAVAAVTTFIGAEHVARFGLPGHLVHSLPDAGQREAL